MDHGRGAGRCLPASQASTSCSYPGTTLTKAPGEGWVRDFGAGLVQILGAVEILGAVGLVLPGLLDVASVLVPVAAIGLALIMIGAAIVEYRRHELAHAGSTCPISL